MDGRLYHKTVKRLVNDKTISLDSDVLVTCGGTYDHRILSDLSFQNVTISNLDNVYNGQLSPYKWSHQDAENLTYADSQFDWVIVHAGLHHCYSPHKALIEMLRVARKGVVVFEARDSLLLRFGKRLGMVAEYEIEAVIGNDLKKGGVQNTSIPNYVYRWTEREVFKIVKSYLPEYKNNDVRFIYNLRLPLKRLSMYDNKLMLLIVNSMKYVLHLMTWLFPKQSNEFGFLIKKGDLLHEWLEEVDNEVKISETYVKKRFTTSKSKI